MSAALRFLVVVVAGWAGVRAMSMGVLPGAGLFTIPESAAAAPPPIARTSFSPIEPVAQEPWFGAEPRGAAWPFAVPTAVPFYYPVPARVSVQPYAEAAAIHAEPVSRPLLDFSLASVGGASLPEFAALPPLHRSLAAAAQQSTPVPAGPRPKPRLDRLRLSAWALLRNQTGPTTLASGGMLGGSQAGARLTYYAKPWLAASLRSSSPVGGRGGEVAAGVRVAPLQSVPLALTIERRQAIGSDGGGRSAFAALLEGGLYDRPLPLGFRLDAYSQAGVVGLRSRDLFAEGGMTFMHPLMRDISVGVGAWGGVQPGLYRIDAGPRVSMRVRNSMRVHVDWRQRLTGNALPASGPALTLAGDF